MRSLQVDSCKKQLKTSFAVCLNVKGWHSWQVLYVQSLVVKSAGYNLKSEIAWLQTVCKNMLRCNFIKIGSLYKSALAIPYVNINSHQIDFSLILQDIVSNTLMNLVVLDHKIHKFSITFVGPILDSKSNLLKLNILGLWDLIIIRY